MRSLLAASVVSCLVLSACKKEQPAEPEAAEPMAAEPAAQPEETEAGAEEVAAAEEEAPIEVTPEMVTKYLAYQEAYITGWKAELEKFKAVARKAEKESSTTATMGMMSSAANMAEAMEKLEDAERQKAGLTEAEADRVREVVQETVLTRMTVKQSQGALEDMAKGMRKQLAENKDLTAQQRAELEAQAADFEKNLKESLDVSEARQRFGDASVDAVLAHEEAFYALQKKALGMMTMAN